MHFLWEPGQWSRPELHYITYSLIQWSANRPCGNVTSNFQLQAACLITLQTGSQYKQWFSCRSQHAYSRRELPKAIHLIRRVTFVAPCQYVWLYRSSGERTAHLIWMCFSHYSRSSPHPTVNGHPKLSFTRWKEITFPSQHELILNSSSCLKIIIWLAP